VIDQTQTFFVRGFSVSWYDIYEKWQKIRYQDPNLFRRLGDPYFDKNTCLFVANVIVAEIDKKLGNDFAFKASSTIDTNTVDTVRDPFANERHIITVEHDWGSIDDIFNKAVKDLEDEYKKVREEQAIARRKKQIEQEEIRRQQEDAKYNDYFRREGKAYQENFEFPKNPPPPLQKANVQELNWRRVIGLGPDEYFDEPKIKLYYRKEAMLRHPDKGGSFEKFNELQVARDEAYKFLGLPLP
jgi:hypothetical protein